MPIKLEELTREVGGQKAIGQIAKDLNLTLKASYDENDPDLTKIRGHKPQTGEKPIKKSKGIEQQIEQRKGDLAQANTDLAKSAIRSGAQLGAKVGELKIRSTVQGMLKTEAKGLSEVARTISDYSDLTQEGMTDLEETFDIDEFLGEGSIDPLLSFGSPLRING